MRSNPDQIPVISGPANGGLAADAASFCLARRMQL
jgi:hypothetical protein